MKNLYKTFLLISISLNTVILSTNNKQYLKIFNENRLKYYGVVLHFYNQKENQLESATNQLIKIKEISAEKLEKERLEKERLENGSILKKNILKIFNRTTTITLNNVKNSIISIIKLKKSPTSLEDADKILIALGIKTIWKPVKNPQGVFFKKTNAKNKDIEEKLIDPMNKDIEEKLIDPMNKDIEEKLIDPMNKDIECINNKINEYVMDPIFWRV